MYSLKHNATPANPRPEQETTDMRDQLKFYIDGQWVDRPSPEAST